jgi:hypothetical protein
MIIIKRVTKLHTILVIHESSNMVLHEENQ